MSCQSNLFRVARTLVACLTPTLLGGCGAIGQQNANRITQRPTDYVVWGDPQSTARSAVLSDASRHKLAIATDGSIVFGNGDVCNDCRVDAQTAQLFIDGELRGAIRWSDTIGDDRTPDTADDGRLPFLVSTDNAILDVVAASSGVTFRRSDTLFDADPSDDTAVQAGTATANSNSSGSGSGGSSSGLCGAGGLLGSAGALTMMLAFGPMRRRAGRGR